MNTTLVFQCTIYVSTRNGTDNFLETSRCALAGRGHSERPALLLTKVGVHPEKVARKECGFVASRTAANFEYGVFCVFGVLGNEQEFYLFLKSRNFSSHIPQPVP